MSLLPHATPDSLLAALAGGPVPMDALCMDCANPSKIRMMLSGLAAAGLVQRVSFNRQRQWALKTWVRPLIPQQQPAKPLRLMALIRQVPLTSDEIAKTVGAGHRRVVAALGKLRRDGKVRTMVMEEGRQCYVPREYEINPLEVVMRVLDRSTDDAGCIRWNDSCDPTGNPVMRYAGTTMRVQLALARSMGFDIPKGMQMVVTCGCQDCVLPEHTKMVTHAVAMQRAAKNGAWQNPARSRKIAMSLRAQRGLFTDEQVAAIRQDPRTMKAIGLAYSCNSSTIGQIKRFETYKSYNDPFAGLRRAA